MSKKHPLCALAVSPYYLDKKRWTVSYMTVTENKQGDLVWTNTEVIATFPDMHTASKCAVSLSNKMRVPIYKGIKKGAHLTLDEIFELDEYGLLAHLKT